LTVSALKIHVSPCTKELLDDYFTFVLELRGPVAMKVAFSVIFINTDSHTDFVSQVTLA